MTPVDLTKINYKALLQHNVYGAGPFQGTRYQRGGMRGAGLGGILTAAMSFIPRFLSSFAGQQLISASKSLAKEIVDGNNLKAGLKNVAKQKLKEYSGSGRRGRRRKTIGKSIKGSSVAVLKPHLVTPRTNFL